MQIAQDHFRKVTYISNVSSIKSPIPYMSYLTKSVTPTVSYIPKLHYTPAIMYKIKITVIQMLSLSKNYTQLASRIGSIYNAPGHKYTYVCLN